MDFTKTRRVFDTAMTEGKQIQWEIQYFFCKKKQVFCKKKYAQTYKFESREQKSSQF